MPGVSYPNPNRSHFASIAIWQTARPGAEPNAGPGWIGRAFDARAGSAEGATSGTPSLFIGDGAPPVALRGRRSSATSLARVEELRLPESLIPSLAETRLAGSTEADESLAAFVRRSLLDSYASAQRVSELVARSAASSSERYPDDPLGERLWTVAQLLKAVLGARVFYTVQPGYDTHAG